MTGDSIQQITARVRAYLDAVPTLYDDENPMHPELVIDTATHWSTPPGPKDPQHELTFKDLTELVDFVETRISEAANERYDGLS